MINLYINLLINLLEAFDILAQFPITKVKNISLLIFV